LKASVYWTLEQRQNFQKANKEAFDRFRIFEL